MLFIAPNKKLAALSSPVSLQPAAALDPEHVDSPVERLGSVNAEDKCRGSNQLLWISKKQWSDQEQLLAKRINRRMEQ